METGLAAPLLLLCGCPGSAAGTLRSPWSLSVYPTPLLSPASLPVPQPAGFSECKACSQPVLPGTFLCPAASALRSKVAPSGNTGASGTALNADSVDLPACEAAAVHLLSYPSAPAPLLLPVAPVSKGALQPCTLLLPHLRSMLFSSLNRLSFHFCHPSVLSSA